VGGIFFKLTACKQLFLSQRGGEPLTARQLAGGKELMADVVMVAL
jgi:hypothetical protein